MICCFRGVWICPQVSETYHLVRICHLFYQNTFILFCLPWHGDLCYLLPVPDYAAGGISLIIQFSNNSVFVCLFFLFGLLVGLILRCINLWIWYNVKLFLYIYIKSTWIVKEQYVNNILERQSSFDYTQLNSLKYIHLTRTVLCAYSWMLLSMTYSWPSRQWL